MVKVFSSWYIYSLVRCEARRDTSIMGSTTGESRLCLSSNMFAVNAIIALNSWFKGRSRPPVQSAAPPRSTNNFLHLGSAPRVAGPPRPAEEAPVGAAEIREDREPVR